jgi:YegS/Rv2252/BmrU family lipid kinase
MRAGLIVNPASGTDRALDLLPRITGRLRARFADLQITVTAGADDARLAAARAVEAGCAALYVAGGDGTLNAALSGMADSPEARYLPIGIIPLGTGNDFAKALDLGEDAEGALDLLMEPLAIDVDLGLMNERPFINVSAGGFVAEVSDAVTPAMKDIAGKLAYLIGGARALMTTTALRMRLSVSSDGAAAMPAGESVIQMFAVCNARFIGGGYAIAPAALIDDGLLDVLVVPQMSWIDFVGVLQQLASTGDPGRDDVLHFRGSAFEFEFDRDAPVNVDGEVLSARHCRYGVRHRSVRFFCGPKPHAAARPQSHSWKTQ